MLWLWLGVMVVAFIIEAASMNLLSIWFSIGALGAFISAIFIDNFFVQAIIFLVISFVLLASTRPIAKKYYQGNIVKTNLDRVIGKIAIVTLPVSNIEKGACKVEGKEWTAVTLKSDTINIGEQVKVLAIDGNKLIVEKI